MIAVDEGALRCDLAETYGVFNYRALPTGETAVLACGLRENSRIRLAITHTSIPLDTMLRAAMLDCLRLLIWQGTADGARGQNRPDSILDQMNGARPDSEALTYSSGAEFERARARILQEVR